MTTAGLEASRPMLRIGGSSYPILLPTLRDSRLHLGAVIVSLQVLGQLVFGFHLSIAQILVSVLTCAVLEVGIAFWRQGVIMWPASALLTGNGVAFILRVPGTEHGDWWSLRGAWIFAATAAVSLLSKHLIRLRGRHVFNPSNFGLVLCFLVLGSGRAEPLDFWWAPMSAWLALALAIIVAGGFAILWRLRLLEIAVSFWLAFAAGIGVLAVSGHAMTARWHLGPITGGHFWWVLLSSPEILVFLFFMITDPKTVPDGRMARRVFAAAVGVVAALLIAPQTTEFASKVALLGALVLVCAARPVIEILLATTRAYGGAIPSRTARVIRGDRIAVRARPTAAAGGIALMGAAAVAGLIVLAGIPARPSASAALPRVENADRALQVTVTKSDGVARIGRSTALQIGRDLAADLRIATDALQRRDVNRAAAGATGIWLKQLKARIGRAGNGALVVPTYHVERVQVALERGEGQSAPIVVASLAGTVENSTYSGSPPTRLHRGGTTPIERTYELAATPGGRYLITRVRGETPGRVAVVGPAAGSASRAGTAASITLRPRPTSATVVRQGIPFRFTATIRNSAGLNVVADVSLLLTRPGGRRVAFLRDERLIPGGRSISIGSTVVTSRWFRDVGPFSVVALVDGKPAGRPLPFTVSRPELRTPTFADVTAAAGLTTRLPATACGEWAAGAAWGDVDLDGDLDLYLPRRKGDARLWINDGRGHFTDQAAARGVADVGGGASGASLADYDNDGDPDLFVFGSRGNRLYRNDNTGVFTDVTATAGVGTVLGAQATSAAWGDYDRDGLLDLYVTFYGACGPFGLQSLSYHRDHLYHNEGNGTFTDVTRLVEQDPARTDDGATTGAGFQAAWFDYDADGDPDLYLANDFLGAHPDRNHLWRNDGPGPNGSWRFTDVSVESSTAFAMNTMGIAIGDYDGDLDLDMALSNIDTNRLLRNNGDGTFTDVGSTARIARPRGNIAQRPVTWGTGFYDFNLDGWEDLYFAGGFFERPVPTANELYVNLGDGTFADLSAPSGASDNAPSRGVAFADYDRDGRIDLYVVNQGTTPRLFRNVTSSPKAHWLEVATVGTRSNRDGCGARLIAHFGERSLIREVSCGSTSLSSWSDTVVHFGLGEATSVSKLMIVWPSGTRQTLRGVRVDRLLTVTEPDQSK
jgi:hypothetical protein